MLLNQIINIVQRTYRLTKFSVRLYNKITNRQRLTVARSQDQFKRCLIQVRAICYMNVYAGSAQQRNCARLMNLLIGRSVIILNSFDNFPYQPLPISPVFCLQKLG